MYELVIRYNDRQFSGDFETRKDIDYVLSLFPQSADYAIYKDKKLVKIGGLDSR